MHDGLVCIWVASDDFALGAAQPILDRWLSPEERARQTKLKSEKDQSSYAATHALMRWALAQVGGVALHRQQMAHGAFGRPSLVRDLGRDVCVPSFNISHARGRIMVAIGPPGTSLGVDVEVPDNSSADVMALGSRFFDAGALAWIAASAEPLQRRERFFQVWTLKEALLKAVGCGLSTPMDSFSLQIEPPAFLSGPANLLPSGRWRLEQWQPDPLSWAALAVDEDPVAPLRIERRLLNGEALLRLLAETTEPLADRSA